MPSSLYNAIKKELLTSLDYFMIGALYKANVEGHCIVFKHMNAILTLYGLFTAKSNLFIDFGVFYIIHTHIDNL